MKTGIFGRQAALGMSLLLGATLVWAAPGVMIRDDNLRSSASSSAGTVASVAKGTAVEVLDRQGGWTQIRAAGRTGWVRLLSVRRGAAAGSDSLGDARGLVELGQRRSDPNKVVAVAGLRGLNEEELRAARFDAQELERLGGYAVKAEEAQQFAGRAGLVRREVAYLPAPASQREQQKASPWGDSSW